MSPSLRIFPGIVTWPQMGQYGQEPWQYWSCILRQVTRWCFSFHNPSRTILLGSWVVDIQSRVSWNVPDLSYYTLGMVKDKLLSVNLIGSQYKWCHSRILLPLGSFHLFPGHIARPLVVSRRRGSHLFNHFLTWPGPLGFQNENMGYTHIIYMECFSYIIIKFCVLQKIKSKKRNKADAERRFKDWRVNTCLECSRPSSMSHCHPISVVL